MIIIQFEEKLHYLYWRSDLKNSNPARNQPLPVICITLSRSPSGPDRGFSTLSTRCQRMCQICCCLCDSCRLSCSWTTWTQLLNPASNSTEFNSGLEGLLFLIRLRKQKRSGLDTSQRLLVPESLLKLHRQLSPESGFCLTKFGLRPQSPLLLFASIVPQSIPIDLIDRQARYRDVFTPYCNV